MKRLYDECGERRKQRRNELKTAEDQLAPIEQEVKQAERDQKDRLNKIRKSVSDFRKVFRRLVKRAICKFCCFEM
jgi:hypothetical protein